MRRVLVAVAVLAGLVPVGFLGYVAWSLGFFAGKPEVLQWRSRYVVTVQTPTGERRGVAVVGHWYADRSNAPAWPSGNIHDWGVRGEAAVADLGGGRYLFALLPRGGPEFGAAKRHYGLAPGDYKAAAARLSQPGQRIALWPDEYPLLVTFADIADPASVKRVDPYDLAASFGPGYALQSVTLEVTDEAVTQGRVERVLGWLGEHPEPSVIPDVKPTDFSFEAKLRHGDFIRRQQ